MKKSTKVGLAVAAVGLAGGAIYLATRSKEREAGNEPQPGEGQPGGAGGETPGLTSSAPGGVFAPSSTSPWTNTMGVGRPIRVWMQGVSEETQLGLIRAANDLGAGIDTVGGNMPVTPGHTIESMAAQVRDAEDKGMDLFEGAEVLFIHLGADEAWGTPAVDQAMLGLKIAFLGDSTNREIVIFSEHIPEPVGGYLFPHAGGGLIVKLPFIADGMQAGERLGAFLWAGGNDKLTTPYPQSVAVAEPAKKPWWQFW